MRDVEQQPLIVYQQVVNVILSILSYIRSFLQVSLSRELHFSLLVSLHFDEALDPHTPNIAPAQSGPHAPNVQMRRHSPRAYNPIGRAYKIDRGHGTSFPRKHSVEHPLIEKIRATARTRTPTHSTERVRGAVANFLR